MKSPNTELEEKEIHNIFTENVDIKKPLDTELIKDPEHKHIEYFFLISQEEPGENGVYYQKDGFLVRRPRHD
jgi:hypothetical protein